MASDASDSEVEGELNVATELSAATLAALRLHLAATGDTDDAEPAEVPAPGTRLPKNTAYSRKDFWDERFETEENYEWLLGWTQLEGPVGRFLTPETRILVLGCGSSRLSSDLYDAGYRCVTSIDFSPVIIEKMRARHATARPEMRWDVMDMTDLRYPDAAFDVVLDKAAMDAIMVDEGDVWDPDDEVKDKADAMCRSVARVLVPDGIFLMVSFMQPHFRRWYILSRERSEASHRVETSQSYGWTVEHEDILSGDGGGGLGNFLYICRKQHGTTPLP